MKVILVNGSPHKNGCTHAALEEVAGELEKAGIETEMFWCGVKPVMGCIGCGKCSATKRCWYGDDAVNGFLEKVGGADGFVFGTPIHFAGTSGAVKPFMDRAFCSKTGIYANKPAAAVVSCRRGGALGGFEDLNRYFTIAGMPVVSSNYWNEVHGNTPDEVCRDLEGMQTMRQLGRNMAWLLRSIEAGREAGVELPVTETKIKTNFIR
ncbi:flavodoxin family protein [Xylanibacter rodentium]|jgi:multimeric flavodoxin WrbA|uniref:Flavodoxin family protein n=1 Tax=Xylanibacter rodentium TaxID=2736289 RepID=A0ABX2AVS8_9BACT|nr:flavodoxin family protein [Xylanibacter rodentium]NPE11361.1 flavodoxin family protein [Prevotella sp. PJ1A]NPE14063.1 flavodoxin family protein [Xylanibacter rodentium]NPE39821.1 flavodoxin family protein [Prevotella sp. PCJ2]